MLKLDKVSKVYKVGTFAGKELCAVSEASFEIGPCEVVSLIGESGSGKSTIGKMILRLLSVTSGSIMFQGQDISEIQKSQQKEYYRRVQGVFQDPFSSFNPIFKSDRIFSNLQTEFFPTLGEAEWCEKVNCVLEDVGLNPNIVLDKYPHQLSGGQLQRFLIARALLLDIQFLVADEIISMLDASTRIDVLNLLADLKTCGLSILFITHDLSLANYISERAIILYRGYIVEIGLTQHIFEKPQHPYTQMLLASVPRLDRKWDRRQIDLKTVRPADACGCPFYDRCPVAEKICTTYRPSLTEVQADHMVACIHNEAK